MKKPIEEKAPIPAPVMPPRISLGKHYATSLATPMHTRRESHYDLTGRRSVMGFALPPWQRPFVWTDEQCVKLLESAWLGLSFGTYTYNHSSVPELDGILIDGQQRMTAIERYLDDAFPVFGYHWSEVTRPEQRRFEMLTSFPSYETDSNDEAWLRNYYNIMNFGGTAHEPGQRA